MTVTISPALVAEARLRGDRSQRVFDVLLRSLAEPGSIHRLPELSTGVAGPAWLALALADVDVAVAVIGDDGPAVAELIARATDAPIVDVAEAAIVIESAALDPAGATAPGPSRGQLGEAIDRIAVGTALAPEDGARLALPADVLVDPDGEAAGIGVVPGRSTVALMLEGPGIDGRRTLLVGGLDGAVLARLGNVDERFPTGFDTWLFGPDRTVAAISRSTTVRLVDRSEAPDPTPPDDRAGHTDVTDDTNVNDRTDQSHERADDGERS